MNIRGIIGAPWAVPCDPPSSFDCWELVRHVRAMIGLRTPSVVDKDRRRPSDRKQFGQPPMGWNQLSEPVEGCVARIGSAHVGVYLNGGDVIHAQLATGVRIDKVEFLSFPVSFWEFEQCR